MSEAILVGAIQGPSGPPMAPVRLATAAPLPSYTADVHGLTMDANGLLAIDGEDVVEGTLVLAQHEGSGTSIYNRLYTVSVAGDGSTPARLLYKHNVAYKAGFPVSVGLGGTNAGLFFQVATDGTIVPGTTPITWQSAGGSAGPGGSGDLLAANNLSDLSDKPTARTNLGLGTAATQASTAFDAAGLAAAALVSANSHADAGDATLMPKNFGSDAVGDIPVRGASAYGRFGIGATGRFLHVLDSASGLLQYVTVAVLPRIDAATASGLPAYSVSGGGTTLVGNANGAFPTVNGVPAALNQTYLLQHGASAVDNGLYQLTTLGDGSTPYVLTRLSRLTVGANAAGMFGIIRGGTQAGYLYYCSSAPGSDIVGTNSLTWAVAKTQLTAEQDALYAHVNSIGSSGADTTYDGGVKLGPNATETLSSSTTAAPTVHWHRIDTSGASRTITLPDSAATGTIHRIHDYMGSFGANNCVVQSQQSNSILNGSTNVSSVTLAIPSACVDFLKTGATTWQVLGGAV